MKRNFYSLSVLLLLLGSTSCVQMATSSERAAPTAAEPRSRTVYTPPTTPGARITAATVLHRVQVSHVFSDPASPDNFVLELRGARVSSGRLRLLVLGSRGDTLFQQQLPASVVLAAPAGPATPVREQEVNLLRGMNEFFAGQNFQQPAFDANAAQPAGLSGPDWNRLRRNPAAVVFRFVGADGQPNRLVYGPASARAVVLDGAMSL